MKILLLKSIFLICCLSCQVIYSQTKQVVLCASDSLIVSDSTAELTWLFKTEGSNEWMVLAKAHSVSIKNTGGHLVGFLERDSCLVSLTDTLHILWSGGMQAISNNVPLFYATGKSYLKDSLTLNITKPELLSHSNYADVTYLYLLANNTYKKQVTGSSTTIPIRVSDLIVNQQTKQLQELNIKDSVVFNTCSPLQTSATTSKIFEDNVVVCLGQHDSLTLDVCAYLSGMVDTLISGTSPDIYLGIVNNDTLTLDTLAIKVKLYMPGDSVQYGVFTYELNDLKPGEDFISSTVNNFEWPIQLEQGTYSLEIELYYKQYFLKSKTVSYYLKNNYDRLPVLSVKPNRLYQYNADSVSFDFSVISTVRSYDSTTLAFKWKSYTVNVVEIPNLNAWDTLNFVHKANISYQPEIFPNDSIEFLIYNANGDTLCRAKSVLKLSMQKLFYTDDNYRFCNLSYNAPVDGLIDISNSMGGFADPPKYLEPNSQPTNFLTYAGTKEKLYGYPYNYGLTLKHSDPKISVSQQMNNMNLKCTFYLMVTDTLLSKFTIIDSLILTNTDFTKSSGATIGIYKYSGNKKSFTKPIDIQSLLSKYPNTYDFFAYFSVKTNHDSIFVSEAPYLNRVYFHVDKNIEQVNSNLSFQAQSIDWPKLWGKGATLLYDSIASDKATYRFVIRNAGSVPAYEVGVYALTPRAAYYLNSDSMVQEVWNRKIAPKFSYYGDPTIYQNPQAYDSLFTYVGLINGVARTGSATQELFYTGDIHKDRIGYVFFLDPFNKIKEIHENDNFFGNLNPDETIVAYCKNGVDFAHVTSGTSAPFITVPGIINSIHYNSQGTIKISEGDKIKVYMNLHKYGRRATTGGVLAVKVIPIPHQTKMRSINYRDIESTPITFTLPLPSFTSNLNTPEAPMIQSFEFEFIPSNYIKVGDAFALATRIDPDNVTGDCNVGQYYPSRLNANDYTYNWSGFVLGTANVIIENLENVMQTIKELSCGVQSNVFITLKNVDAAFGTTSTFYVRMTDNMGNTASLPVNGIKAGESKMVAIPFSLKRAYQENVNVKYVMNLTLDMSNTLAPDSIKTYTIVDTIKVNYVTGGLPQPVIATFKERNLTWKPVAGAVGYEYTIYTLFSNSSSRIVIKTGFTTTTSFTGFGFYSDGFYYAEVKAYNNNCGLSINTAKFYYTSPPPPPAKTVVINTGGTTTSNPRPDDKPEDPGGCQYSGLPVETTVGKRCGSPTSMEVFVTNTKSYPIDICICILRENGTQDCLLSSNVKPGARGATYTCETKKKYTVRWRKVGASCKVCP